MSEVQEQHTGADTLVQTLIAGSADTCFTNPGTSEMYFAGALDRDPGMGYVPGLFEGIDAGAATGIASLASKRDHAMASQGRHFVDVTL